ncbi:MAG TPA: hypothetical protein VE954_06595 [Oligoflexus sp.]|uniref:hypothetical protein n=1 Tax=Oligoflexus sp. TaxID=1971216 RepID=UPI002D4FD45C|nr:hypothetical protein [Oligoflexus sp.]HYX32765.1 hypothetical protein [Oligoflexus sp.]
MKQVFLLTVLHASASFAGQTGGGGGLGKQQLDLTHSAFNLEQLPALYVHDDVLRRTSARLSVDGVETVDMPLDGNGFIKVRRLQSSIVDVAITRKVLSNP